MALWGAPVALLPIDNVLAVAVSSSPEAKPGDVVLSLGATSTDTWIQEAKKYASGIDPAARFLSRISQPGRIVTYFLSCIAISTVIYLGLGGAAAAMGGGLAITVGIFMGINFHHYVVDALIWKRRRTAPA